MLGEKTIKKLGTELEVNLEMELRDQGHYLTGALERSIKTKVSGSSSTVLETTALDYITDLEEGVKPWQVPTDAAYIQEMADYATKRMGVTGKEALRIGVLIARKHRKEGVPTANSYQFSTTGERLGGITDSYTKNEAETDDILENGLSVELDDFIDKTFDQTIF
jgi:hypothetical protein